jgi:hypothetical protein
VVLLALLCTCGVESANPLGPADKAVLDKALLGSWTSTDRKEPIDVEISLKAKGVMRLVLTGGEKEEPLEFQGHVTQLGALRLLNLQGVEDGKVQGAFVFVRYAVRADGTLETWLLQDKVVSEAVQKGTLKGRPGSYGGTVLSDTSEKIVAFVQSQRPEALFEAFQIFAKKPSAPPK